MPAAGGGVWIAAKATVERALYDGGPKLNLWKLPEGHSSFLDSVGMHLYL